MTIDSAPVVLARRFAGAPGCFWEARIGDDRGRLQVVLVVEPSADPVVVPMLTSTELEALLSEAPQPEADRWACRECNFINPSSRRWCSRCSSHDGAAA